MGHNMYVLVYMILQLYSCRYQLMYVCYGTSYCTTAVQLGAAAVGTGTGTAVP
jgi:hypothetical protein